MALAIRMERLLREGAVADYADIARLGYVTRARVSQIMNLLNLAPDIQEDLLFLPRTERGRDPIREIHIRPILRVLDWRKQRRIWEEVKTLAEQ
jgi:integrase